MKKTLLTLAMALTLAFTAATAQAAPITLSIGAGDPYYLGSVDPSSPSRPSDEVGYINYLLTLTAPSVDVIFDGHTYDRSNLACAGCPSATTTGAFKDEAPFADLTNLDLSSWTYLLAKHGGTSYVWYVANQNDVTIPFNPFGDEKRELSHFSLYKSTTTRVPDGGATLGLLGLGLVGLGYLRRRMF